MGADCMNEDQLRSFVDAVDMGSFSAAARRHFLSVPSFSHRIDMLENELGFRLFERSHRGVTPTVAGECLYESVKRALAILSEGKGRARVLAGHGCAEALEGERISVGIWWQADDSLVRAADEMSRTWGVRVDFIETDFNHAAEGLAKRRFDLFPIYQARSFDRLGFVFLALGKSRMHCAFAPTSRLAECETISMRQLRDVTVYAGSDYRDIVELEGYVDEFEGDNVVKESIFTEQLVMRCLQGEAVSFFGGSTMAKISPPLAVRPMDWPPITFGLYGTAAVWEKPAIKKFAEECRRAIGADECR